MEARRTGSEEARFGFLPPGFIGSKPSGQINKEKL